MWSINTKRRTLQPVAKQHVERGAQVFTDALASYAGLPPWRLFKWRIKGTHISVEPFHLFRYVDAECFRFNNRETDDGHRFTRVLGMAEGKRLTYKSLIEEHAESRTADDNGEGSANAKANKADNDGNGGQLPGNRRLHRR